MDMPSARALVTALAQRPPKPSTGPSPPFFSDHGHRPGFDPTGDDGSGGIGGLMDPYDRPTRSQLKGAQSRLRMDTGGRSLPSTVHGTPRGQQAADELSVLP
ncbi:hypothetical protein Agub_g2776 [Astrephomene gubernaculifera]|uniref:Uncharacterized protein n=1 Tax=Astrephomene gubernaculifera TaxID=47775 RepID=A0AAD3HIV6_9CHLO|nr:hypothetical protein Agub_g2776 [Astrephomene gubernaculifera]